MNDVRFSPRRVAIIAHTTWLEAVRQRFFALLILGAVCLVLSSLFLREFNFGASELKFIADFGFGAMTLFGSILAIVGTAQVFFSEIENRTVLTLLAKPMLRSEFVAGKFAGVGMMLLAFIMVIAATLSAVLAWRGHALSGELIAASESGAGIAIPAVAVFALLQWMKFLIVCAITLLVASYANTHLFTVLTSFVVLVICHLQPTALGVWEHSAAWGPRLAGGALGVIVPNFQLFNLGDGIASGGRVAARDALIVTGYAAVYVGVVLSLAVWSFRRREI